MVESTASRVNPRLFGRWGGSIILKRPQASHMPDIHGKPATHTQYLKMQERHSTAVR